MDFERSSEFLPPMPAETDAGYSEKDAAKVVEGSLLDTKQIGNKRKRLLHDSSRKNKIIASYKANLEKIFQLVEAIAALEGKNYRQEEQLLEEIKRLRHLQEELLNALILDQKGSLSQENFSKEAWSMII